MTVENPALRKLLGAASVNLSTAGVTRAKLPAGVLGDELAALLEERNGFYSFESSLLVRPVGSEAAPIRDVDAWNAGDVWKYAYPGFPLRDVFFFAEDIFAGQFGIKETAIVSFNPETGELVEFAESVEAWAARILDDWGVLTGYPLAHEWQSSHGALPAGGRLVPKIPFVLGGEFSLENLRLATDSSAMRFYGGLATTLAGIPDGSEIAVDIVGLSAVLDVGPGVAE